MILFLHPHDNSTRFLSKISNYISKRNFAVVERLSVGPTIFDHDRALSRISNPEFGLIIAMGHGRSDSFFGAKGDWVGSLVSVSAKAEDPEPYYDHGVFLDYRNFALMKGKAVLGLWCNSGDDISKMLMHTGASCIIGFGKIPTDDHELQEMKLYNHRFYRQKGQLISTSRLTSMFRAELVWIVTRSLQATIDVGGTMQILYDWLRFYCDYRRISLYVTRRNCHLRKDLCGLIDQFRSRIVIKGDPETVIT